jgi:biopolymer transport protein ExbB/TolQ
MLDLHTEGGLTFMIPLTLLLLTNLGIILFVLLSKETKTFLLEAIRQIGGLALVWGIFSTIIGFYQAFGDLSRMKEPLPFYIIMGGMKVALITAVYGLIIFMISLLAYIGLKMLNRNSSQ